VRDEAGRNQPERWSTVDEQLEEYPKERVVGIALDTDTVDAAREATRDLDGVTLEVLEPEQHDEVTTEPDDTGDSFVTKLRTLFGDEAPRLSRLSEALSRGHYVVLADLPDRDDDEDAHDAAKRQAGNALVGAGLGEVAYYGRWAIEEFQISDA
jgi:hypothetical protein